jgi:predicted XRE-type DNA-binding protein
MKKQNVIKTAKSVSIDFFDFNDADIEFEEMVINSDTMSVIRKLMVQNNISRDELASRLKVSQPYISKLFTSDKYFNVSMLAKLQRIFKIRFKVVTTDMITEYKNYNKITIGSVDSQKSIDAFISIDLKPNSISIVSESLVASSINGMDSFCEYRL